MLFPALRSGDVCLGHENHRPGDLLRCQVIRRFLSFTSRPRLKFPDPIIESVPLQRLLRAAFEGRAAAVFQRAALRVLVPVREVSGVSRGGAGGGGHLLLHRDPDVDLCLADAADPVHHSCMSSTFEPADGPYFQETEFVCFQADVMHLRDDLTKLKLSMVVLDGTKATVSSHNLTHLHRCVSFSSTVKLVFFLVS